MGGQTTRLTISPNPPTIVMMAGLQGAGKTTNCAKLAALLRKQQQRRPLLVACDVYRPAAIEQLKVVGKQLNIPVLTKVRAIRSRSQSTASTLPARTAMIWFSSIPQAACTSTKS